MCDSHPQILTPHTSDAFSYSLWQNFASNGTVSLESGIYIIVIIIKYSERQKFTMNQLATLNKRWSEIIIKESERSILRATLRDNIVYLVKVTVVV